MSHVHPHAPESSVSPLWTDPARETAFRHWLASLEAIQGMDASSVRLASADASFRRYLRVDGAAGSCIIMDAPPLKEDCRPFVKVAQLMQQAGLLAPHDDDPSPTQQQIAKALAAQKIAQLRRMVEGETKRRTAEQLGRDHVQMYGIPQLAENVEFLRASGDQLRQMRRVVAPLARMLATRLAARRRRSRAGAIDLRKTLRKSMSTGGVPIDLVLRKPRPARPELVVLCDVSGSVAGFSHFTLLLVDALRQQFSRVRVFAFIDTTDEVTHLFGPDADLAVAIQRITREAGVYTRDGHSDYGNAFVSFTENFHNVLSPRSSLLVLGDGRTNYRNPAVDVLAHMVTASRHAHWLNPEPRHLWGSGDSAVPRYEDVITMHECRSAKQLAAVIDQLLPV